MQDNPRISVLLPVFNRERYLARAVDSVLAQTFTDFELILIDDGSTDASLEIMRSYADPRIRTEVHERNMGLPATLNQGLAMARGQYVARLDSDDYAFPRRLQMQIGYLDRHPNVAMTGSWYRRCDAVGGRDKLKKRPVKPEEIKAAMLFICCIQHPTVTGRTSILRRYGFREDYAAAEDFDTWVRIATEHSIVNIDEALVRCYRHDQQQGEVAKQAMADDTRLVCARQLDALGVAYDRYDQDRHALLLKRDWRTGASKMDEQYMEWARDWLEKLVCANRREPVYQQRALERVIGEIWFKLCRSAARAKGMAEWKHFVRSPIWRTAYRSRHYLWSNRL